MMWMAQRIRFRLRSYRGEEPNEIRKRRLGAWLLARAPDSRVCLSSGDIGPGGMLGRRRRDFTTDIFTKCCNPSTGSQCDGNHCCIYSRINDVCFNRWDQCRHHDPHGNQCRYYQGCHRYCRTIFRTGEHTVCNARACATHKAVSGFKVDRTGTGWASGVSCCRRRKRAFVCG